MRKRPQQTAHWQANRGWNQIAAETALVLSWQLSLDCFVCGGLESRAVQMSRQSAAACCVGTKHECPWQVYQALRSDFSSRRKDRCIRVDFSGGVVSGMDDLERMLRDAIKSTFEARAAAYDEQVHLQPQHITASLVRQAFRLTALLLSGKSSSIEVHGCWQTSLNLQ